MTKPTRVPNTVLRSIRESERHETRAEFAQAMARVAAAIGEAVSPSERYVAHLEDGDIKYPNPAYRRVLANLCSRPIAELGFRVPDSGDVRLTQQSIPSALTAPRSESGLTAAGLHRVEDIRRAINVRIGGIVIPGAEVEDWELTALQHGRASRYKDPGSLLTDVTADLGELNHVMARGGSASAVRRLTRVAAELSGIVCLLMVKLGERQEFRNWARTARVAAEECGDPGMLSWVRAQEAYGHYYSGDLAEAISVARHAQEVVPRQDAVGYALGAALEARALARLGTARAREAVEALRRAESALGRLGADDLIPSALGYSEAQLRFHEGSIYTHLKDTDSAWRAQSSALALIPEGDYTDRVLTRLDRAICLAQDGDAREAVKYAADALDALTSEQRRGIINASLIATARAIPQAQRALPAVREFSDLARELQTSDGD